MSSAIDPKSSRARILGLEARMKELEEERDDAIAGNVALRVQVQDSWDELARLREALQRAAADARALFMFDLEARIRRALEGTTDE